MNRLRQPGDSEYDVLGVSPGATEKEIDRAFRQLIDGQGYKVGVPLNRQWLRARQIKAAHATLSDPEKRRAYDESLSGAAGPAPWAMTANDPATDELVLSEVEPEAAEPADDGAAPVAAVPPSPDESVVSEPVPPDSESVPPADAVASVEGEPAWMEFVPTADDSDRGPVRRWAMATAAVVGLGLVLLTSWSVWDRQPPTGESEQGVIADAWQAGGAGPGLGSYPAQAPGNADGAAASDLEEQGDTPAALGTPGQPTEPRSASEEPTTQGSGDVTSSTADASAGTTSAAAAPTAAPTQVAEAQAMPPASPPPAARAPEIAPAPVKAASSGSAVRNPPQWVGGGPTDADNRRGRYQGTVAVQITVEPDGSVSNCAPVRGSGNAGLDSMTCQLVRERARFNPALDAQGRPVASQAYTTFVWGRRPRD